MQFVSRKPGATSTGFLPLVLLALLLLAFPADAQIYTVLHAFSGADGSNALASLVTGSDGNLYGTTFSGGAGDKGTVFRMTPGGTATTLHSFTGSDGQNPLAALVEGSDGSFYGTTQDGGPNGRGTVFRMSAAGTLVTLHAFAGSDGGNPRSGLVQGTDGDFYGTTSTGGANDTGTVFRMTPGGAFTTLATFPPVSFVVVHVGGTGALVQGRDGNFYGTTIGGGTSGLGTVFRITPSGALTTLHSFTGVDGAAPVTALVPAGDGSFFGTTNAGGAGEPTLPVMSRAGTVFRITTSGALTTLHSFTGSGGQVGGATLVRGSDGDLRGTTATGGAQGCGTVFRMTPDGTLTTLHTLSPDRAEGCAPFGALAEGADGSFYGTTSAFGDGVAFRVSRDPELFLPVVLDDVPGLAGSRYATELTFSSKAATAIQVDFVYTASVGTGSGSVSVTLGAGETRIVPNAFAYLRSQGLPVPLGPAIGTLRATFVGARPSDAPFLGARTYTAGGGGTFGVFTPSARTAATIAALVGLRQNAAQRSNLALVNAGADPLALHVRLYGPAGEDLGALPDAFLPPYGWTQINAPLEGWAASGRAVVTGSTPFTAYAVLNDAVTSDGSYIGPVLSRAPGSSLVPVILDARGIAGTHYTTELTLVNLTSSYVSLTLGYTAALGSGSGQVTHSLAPGEQQIVPDAVAFLRSEGLSIPADGSSVGGSLLVSGPAFVVARTSTPNPSGGGAFGTCYPGVPPEDWADALAYVDGLQQTTSRRSNLALVNAGDAADSITLDVSYVDEKGAALGAPASVTLAPGQWTQFNQPLAGLGASFGYARIEKTSGRSRFVAYGILNDAATSDGSYIPMTSER